jgi:hypothetical protein
MSVRPLGFKWLWNLIMKPSCNIQKINQTNITYRSISIKGWIYISPSSFFESLFPPFLQADFTSKPSRLGLRTTRATCGEDQTDAKFGAGCPRNPTMQEPIVHLTWFSGLRLWIIFNLSYSNVGVPRDTILICSTDCSVQESMPTSSKATTGKPRVLKLTDQQKEDIESMASPSCMDPSERKRQYSAMRRAIAKSCEPALLAKFQLCNDGERCHSHFLFNLHAWYLLCNTAFVQQL